MAGSRWRRGHAPAASAVAVALCLVVTACSGGDGGRQTAAGPGSSTVPEPITAPADAAPVEVRESSCGHGCTPPADLGPAGTDVLPLREATAELGLDGTPGYGRGASLVDLDADGWDDLVLTDTDSRFRGDDSGRTRVLRNDRGSFTPWDIGLDDADVFENGGAVFGDYTGDGAPDLFVVNGNNTGPSRLALYENRLRDEGRFVDRTDAAGISAESLPWWGAAWFDADADGRLDLVVTGPRLLLYMNDGDGHLTESARARGLDVEGELRNPVVTDVDDDGDPDVFVAAFTADSRMFLNSGDGRFTDATDRALGPKAAETSRWVWAAVAEDFDQDGHDDLWLGRWYFQDRVLFGRGDGTFEQHDADIGVVTRVVADDDPAIVNRDASSPLNFTNYARKPDDAAENTMGLGTGDLDANGYPDVVIGTGDPTRANPLIVFCGFPGGPRGVTFRRCSEPARTAVGDSRGHGIVTGDIDRDGALDLVLNPGGFPPFDVASGADTRETPVALLGVPGADRPTASLRLLSGTGAPAVGARVTVGGPGRRLHLTVRPAQGFQNQNSSRLVVPVEPGAVATVDWPGGARSEVPLVAGADLTVAAP